MTGKKIKKRRKGEKTRGSSIDPEPGAKVEAGGRTESKNLFVSGVECSRKPANPTYTKFSALTPNKLLGFDAYLIIMKRGKGFFYRLRGW